MAITLYVAEFVIDALVIRDIPCTHPIDQAGSSLSSEEADDDRSAHLMLWEYDSVFYRH